LEGRFPPNIPVGEITEASILRQKAQEQVIVRPYADIRNLNVLQVLTGGRTE
jgi:cell shape-determining protein MreC